MSQSASFAHDVSTGGYGEPLDEARAATATTSGAEAEAVARGASKASTADDIAGGGAGEGGREGQPAVASASKRTWKEDAGPRHDNSVRMRRRYTLPAGNQQRPTGRCALRLTQAA